MTEIEESETEESRSEKREVLIDEILYRLPYRQPFLLIDRVLDWRAGEYIIARKCVSYNEDFFQGHFSHFPVLPGVLQIEMAAQASALMAALEDQASKEQLDVRFVKVDNARFLKEVRPGDVLDIKMKEVKRKGNFRWGEGKIMVGEETVMTVSIVAFFAIKKREEDKQ